MSMPVPKPAPTPIPVQWSENAFDAFILPSLSMPTYGPKSKLDYHRVFNLTLGASTPGCNGSVYPFRKTSMGNRPFMTRPSTKSLPHGLPMGRCGKRVSPVCGLSLPRSTAIFACCIATGPRLWPKQGQWHWLFGVQTPEGGESHCDHG
jgi:hypothetical protein